MVRPGTTRAELRYVLARAMAALDERGLNQFLNDDSSSIDAFLAALTIVLADATTTTDTLLPFQWESLRNDNLTTQEAWTANSALVFADGAPADYFAGDYSLSGDYNATDNFSSDAYAAALASDWADNSVAVDAIAAALASVLQDSLSTSEAWIVSSSSNALDAFVTSESISGWVQGYSVDPSYFSGDYATPQFL